MTQALGIDVSRYNGIVNWEVARENGVTFTGIRVAISYAYRDPYGVSNMIGARQQGIYAFAYHPLYPESSPAMQADNYLQATNGFDVWPVPDLELDHDQTVSRITDTALEYARLVERSTGKRPVFYSRASWVNQYMTLGAWRDTYQWWLAQYLYDRTQEKPSPPLMPSGATKWLIHQNCDQKPAWLGLQTGGIIACDINRWNGDDNAVRAFFGGEPVLTLEQRVERLEKWVEAHG